VAAQLTRWQRLLWPEEDGNRGVGYDGPRDLWALQGLLDHKRRLGPKKNGPAWEIKPKKKVKRAEVLLGRQVIMG
jgi:hypothetical protein